MPAVARANLARSAGHVEDRNAARVSFRNQAWPSARCPWGDRRFGKGMVRGIGEPVSSRLISVLALVAVSAAARPAHAVDPVPSFRYLVTGNGFRVRFFDVSANAVKQYLERPYRYIRANPEQPRWRGDRAAQPRVRHVLRREGRRHRSLDGRAHAERRRLRSTRRT